MGAAEASAPATNNHDDDNIDDVVPCLALPAAEEQAVVLKVGR